MKRKFLLRLTALVLAVLLLAGCGGGTSRSKKDREAETTLPTEPAQREMAPEEKEAALRRLEYALVSAAIDTDNRIEELDGYILGTTTVYVGDYNGDGAEDLLYGPYAHTFDARNRRITDNFSQSGLSMFVDKDGTLYLEESMYGGYDYELDGKQVFGSGQDFWYMTWDGAQWVSSFGYYYSSIEEIILDEEGEFSAWGEILEEETYGVIGEQRVTIEEYEAYVEQLGLTEVETKTTDFMQLSFDSAYAEDLLPALEEYLGSIYDLQTVTADCDGDGTEEMLFFVQSLPNHWLGNVSLGEFQDEQGFRQQFQNVMDTDRGLLCVLVADREGSELTFTAGCMPKSISVYQGMDIRMDGGFLWVGGLPMYLPGQAPAAEPGWFGEYVQLHGYSNCLTRAVDLSDLPGNEYLCLAQKDGVWYVIILIVENGSPKTVYTRTLENTALYLTEKDGKQCLLLYTQQVRTLWDGRVETWYEYTLFRIGTDGLGETLDYQFHAYTSDEPDATATAAFFDKLNVYIIKIVVVRDPFCLTGKMWMTSDGWNGDIPAEPVQEQQPTEQPKSQMGFVQINDPGSWLNLREGPGTEYPRVLMDPADPESYVKQALGSPVTVLETVKTNDPENPVWLKIRIHYGDREFVGYSSKTYIRLVEE